MKSFTGYFLATAWATCGPIGAVHGAALGSELVPKSTELSARSVGVYRPIKAMSGSLCLEPEGGVPGGRLILNPCDNNKVTQFWGPFRDSDNIYRFQNRATVDCIWINDKPSSGAIVGTGECTLSDGSGLAPSNAEWDIGVNMPPAAAKQMKSRVGHTNTNLCITAGGNGLVTLTNCVSGLGTQVWILGAD